MDKILSGGGVGFLDADPTENGSELLKSSSRPKSLLGRIGGSNKLDDFSGKKF